VPSIHEITAARGATGVSAEAVDLLRHFGLTGFNQVTPRTGSRTEATIAGQPLVVTGVYGEGKAAVFTAVTPAATDFSAMPLDQYTMYEPQARAYFAVFADLLAGVLPGGEKRNAELLEAHRKPLFQVLKEQPPTELAVSKAELASATGGAGRATVRITNTGGYAHLVHMRFEWTGAGAKPYMAEMSDNDFELLPGESREIQLNWKTAPASQPASGTLIVNAANAAQTRLTF
jgi:hypothetical protein